MCFVCGRHAVETRLYNCQHEVTCRRCARTARRCPACGERILCFLTLWGQGDCPPMPCLWRTHSVLFHTVRAGRLPADGLPVENAFCAFSHCEGRETARRCPACGGCVLCFFTLWGQKDCTPWCCQALTFPLSSFCFVSERRASNLLMLVNVKRVNV